MPKKEAEEIMKVAYQGRYDFLMIDASLRNGADFEFYRNFNKLEFEEEEDKNEKEKPK